MYPQRSYSSGSAYAQNYSRKVGCPGADPHAAFISCQGLGVEKRSASPVEAGQVPVFGIHFPYVTTSTLQFIEYANHLFSNGRRNLERLR